MAGPLSYQKIYLGKKELRVDAGTCYVIVTKQNFEGTDYISVEVGPYTSENLQGHQLFDYTGRGIAKKRLVGDGKGVMLAIMKKTSKKDRKKEDQRRLQ